MKALILAAGRGKRLGRISQGLNKCMLGVHGRPLIEYSLECASRLKPIKEIIIVIGYRGRDIQRQYQDYYNGKKISYVRQGEQSGLVNAIGSAASALGSSDFMVMLGDELMINPRHQEFLQFFKRQNVFALCGMLCVNDKSLIRKTYTVIQAKDSRVYRLVEKPNFIFNNLMGTGNCLFKNQILSYIPKTPINQNRREKELPDLIQCAIDDGHIVKTFVICSEYINVNSREELALTNSYFAHI